MTLENAGHRFEQEVAHIWPLNREGMENTALDLARVLVDQYPDDPLAHFALARALDVQGREAEAVAPCRRAQALGLSGDDLPYLYVRLGSTPRKAGETMVAASWAAMRRVSPAPAISSRSATRLPETAPGAKTRQSGDSCLT